MRRRIERRAGTSSFTTSTPQVPDEAHVDSAASRAPLPFVAGTCPKSRPGARPYQTARAERAAGDTVAGLQGPERLTVDEPDFAPGWGLLGLTFTLRASSVETDFRERREAEATLQRALEFDPGNPLYLFSLGLLRLKQLMTPDSERLMRRAIRALEQQPDRLTSLELDEFVLLRRMLALNEARQAQREF